MNAQSKVKAADPSLELLRAPFPDHQVSKLPKETRKQIDERKAGNNVEWKCKVCGGAHHKNAVHLDYVGHAALTDRLLDTDPEWSWEPLAYTELGLPAFDQSGGLWIKLTVLGVTRLGYGHAAAKPNSDPGAREKEIIGDALRNAAMRFGAALDLWHKGDLHLEDDTATDGADQGHSEKGAVSPDGPTTTTEKPVRNWGGRYPNKTALRKARVIHHAEIERIGIEGTFDDLDGYLTSPEYQDYIKTASEQHPLWLEGEIPEEMREQLPAEYVQTFALETKARDMIAIRGNVAADAEPA